MIYATFAYLIALYSHGSSYEALECGDPTVSKVRDHGASFAFFLSTLVRKADFRHWPKPLPTQTYLVQHVQFYPACLFKRPCGTLRAGPVQAESGSLSGFDFDSCQIFEHTDRAADVVFAVTLGHRGLKELLRQAGKKQRNTDLGTEVQGETDILLQPFD